MMNGIKANFGFLLIFLFSLLINVQEFLIVKTEVKWISYVDEFFLFIPYFLILFLQKNKDNGLIFLLLLLPFLSIAYTLIFNVIVFNDLRFFEAVVQSFINCKFFLYFALFYCVERIFFCNVEGSNYFRIVFFSCLMISLSGYFLNIAYPDFFVFSDMPWHLERGRIAGFQFKPNDLAIFLSLYSIYLLLSIKSELKKNIIVLILILMVFLTSSRTALLVSIVPYFLYHLRRRNIIFTVLCFWCFFLLFIYFYEDIASSFFITETIENFKEFYDIDNSQYIRFIILYLGLVLSFDYFPFGVGAGNFASVMSQGSPVYSYLGVENNYFFVNMIGVYDSNFASLLGEYGVTGFFASLFISYLSIYIVLREPKFSLFLFFVLLFLMAFQPVLSYQVNSINFLLLIFSLKSSVFMKVNKDL